MRILTCSVAIVIGTVTVSAAGVVSPREAIEAAMRARFGAAAVVEVVDLQTTAAPEDGLIAIPDPGARTGVPSPFTLVTTCGARAVRACTVSRGTAMATVRVSGRFVKADAVVTIAPAVKAGAPVEVTVIVGAVRATGSGIAASSGQPGDVITILPTPTRRAVRARITGPAAVEIVR